MPVLPDTDMGISIFGVLGLLTHNAELLDAVTAPSSCHPCCLARLPNKPSKALALLMPHIVNLRPLCVALMPAYVFRISKRISTLFQCLLWGAMWAAGRATGRGMLVVGACLL